LPIARPSADGDEVDRRDEVVEALHGVAGADRAEVEHRLAHDLEQRPDALDVGRRAAAHEDELGGLGAPLRARDRRVDHRHAGVGEASRVASVSHGSDDDVSSSSVPWPEALQQPSAPSTSDCTTAPLGTIVTTMSLRAASSAGVRAAFAPASVAATSSARPGAMS
jgi:hypothetical protein